MPKEMYAAPNWKFSTSVVRTLFVLQSAAKALTPVLAMVIGAVRTNPQNPESQMRKLALETMVRGTCRTICARK